MNHAPAPRPAFTLMELLVVIAIIALLLGMLLPALGATRTGGRAGVCLSNARQLAAAVDLYATDSGDRYAPGAANALANLDRWHGRRTNTSEPFDAHAGPLSAYFDASGAGPGRAIRECPEFALPLALLREGGAGFERGCGGYAYNTAFAGTDRAPERWITTPTLPPRGVSGVRTDALGASRARFLDPAGTLAFADGAFAAESPANNLIEYSFAEPRFHPHLASPSRPDPSIHFRHASPRSPRAIIAWLDGHASPEALVFTWSSGLYPPTTSQASMGWPGQRDDNSMFDYR